MVGEEAVKQCTCHSPTHKGHHHREKGQEISLSPKPSHMEGHTASKFSRSRGLYADGLPILAATAFSTIGRRSRTPQVQPTQPPPPRQRLPRAHKSMNGAALGTQPTALYARSCRYRARIVLCPAVSGHGDVSPCPLVLESVALTQQSTAPTWSSAIPGVKRGVNIGP